MKLITKPIERKLDRAPLYTHDGKPACQVPVIVKFFDPTGRGAWYVTEAERGESGDWEFFGYCRSPLGPDCDEMGYFTLNQLQSVRGRFGLGIERDMHFDGRTLEDVKNGEL